MITRSDVDALSRLQSDRWPIISLTLRVDKERIDDDYTIRLKNLLREAADSLDERFDHEQREAVLADLERIREFFRDEGHKFGQGAALFAATQAGSWQVHQLPRDVGSTISVDFKTNVAPIIKVFEQLEPFVTCLIARNSARIFYGRLGAFEELRYIVDEDVPGQHDQGGWSQARFERHIEEHARNHYKRVANELFQLFEEQPFRWLVIGGPDEVAAAFLEQLHPYLRERHAGTVRLLMEANIKEVLDDSRDIIRRWIQQEKERGLELLRSEVMSSDLGVAGVEATMEALQQGQILTLLVDDTLQTPGAVCTNCDAVQREDGADSQCQFCGGPLQHLDDVIPTIITRTFRQGANLLFMTTPEQQSKLRALGGIGALLRFRANNPSSN